MASQDSRELVIHRFIWVRKQIRSKQHVGQYVGNSVGKQSVDCRPIICRLSISYHWWFIEVKRFLFCFIVKFTYHNYSFPSSYF